MSPVHRWLSRRAPGFPGPKPSLLAFGNVGTIFRKGMLDAYQGWSRELGGKDFVIWAGATPHIVISRPESVRHVVRHGSVFRRDARPTVNLFGNSVIRLGGSAWRARRNLLSHGFHPESIEEVVPIIQEEIATLAGAWRGRAGTPFSPVRDVSFAMLRILGRFLFGFQFDRDRHANGALHRSLITLSLDPVFRHFLPEKLVELYHRRDVARARGHMDAFCREILEGADGTSTPFLESLRTGVATRELDAASVIDELRTFLIAGHETSATALNWTLAMLATHPGIQAEAREEAANAGAIRSIEDLGRLRLTKAVIREAMRLYPPVPISIYEAAEDTELSGLPVAKGTRVDLCSYVLHRNPDLWKEPERFDPSRFLGPEPVSHFQYFPFLMGSHTCMGMRLAMAELPLAVAGILSAYRLSAPEGPPKVNLRLSLHPARFRLLLEPLRS